MKRRRLSCPPSLHFPFLLFASASLSIAQAQLRWDPNGSDPTDPSDGAGDWNGANVWFSSGENPHGSWVAGSLAIFGNGGNAGIVNLRGGNYSVSGLQFDAVNLGSTTTNDSIISYRFTSGTITLPENGVIDIRNGSTGSQADDRLRFDNILAGRNITISNTNSTTGTGFVRLGGANTWTGNLTLDSSSGGQFIEVLNASSLSTLDRVIATTGVTLALNVSNATFSGPTLEIRGSGSSSRGALRIDATSTVQNNIVLGATTTIGTGNSVNTIATLSGNISGNFQINQTTSSSQTSFGAITYSGENTFGALLVSRGNAQIGSGGVGTSGNGLVTVNGISSVLSGTGHIKNGLTVTTGIVKPGDRTTGSGVTTWGAALGELRVTGALTFNPGTRASMAEFQIGNPSAASDKISVAGNLVLNGMTDINVAFASGYAATLGDRWDLITYTGTLNAGTFDLGTNHRNGADANQGNLILPDISSTPYLWEVDLANGALTATIVVPEPSAALLFGASTTLLALRRRRKSSCGE